MTTYQIAKKIARAFRNAPSGVGGVPYDTGLLKYHSINALTDGQDAIVAIGGEKGTLAFYAPYLEFCDTVGNTDKPNKHKGWVENVLVKYVVPVLKEL
jgi:hypothetical protein